MKQSTIRGTALLFNLPVLSTLLILLLAASWLLASAGFDGIFTARLFSTPQGLVVLVFGPLALLAFSAVLLYSLISEHLHRPRGGRIRVRFFWYFLILILCSAIPQTLIVSRFVGSALASWFDNTVSDSLAAAEEIADLYTAERSRAIQAVADRYLNGLAISNYRSRPADWMQDIRSIDPHALACQVYLAGTDIHGQTHYSMVIELGDSERFYPVGELETVPEGLFTRSVTEDVFRFGRTVRYSNAVYIAVYSSLIPPKFNARLDRIRSGYEQSRIIDRLRPHLPTIGVWLFAVFSLPVLLMVIILAMHMSARLGEPLVALEEAATRLSVGDASVRVVPHSKDELSGLARALNSLADQRSTEILPKTGDKKNRSGV